MKKINVNGKTKKILKGCGAVFGCLLLVSCGAIMSGGGEYVYVDDTSYYEEDVVVLLDKVNDLEDEKEKLEEENKQLVADIEKANTEFENYKKEIEPYQEIIDAEKQKTEEQRKLEQEQREKEEEERKQKEEEEKAKAEEEERIKKEQEEQARLEQEQKEKEEQERLEKEKYNTGLTYEDLARNPQEHMFKYVKFSGKVVQVMNGDTVNQYRLAIDDNYDQVVLLELDKSKLTNGNILEDDYITIEGMFFGEVQYTTVLGATRSISDIIVDNVYFN